MINKLYYLNEWCKRALFKTQACISLTYWEK